MPWTRQLIVFALPATFALGLVAGCDAKPSEEECTKARDKYLSLLNEDMGLGDDTPEDDPLMQINVEAADGIASDCKQNGTKKWIECTSKATNQAEFDACEK